MSIICTLYDLRCTRRRKSCGKPNESLCPNVQTSKQTNESEKKIEKEKEKLRMEHTHKTINCAIVIVRAVKSMTPFFWWIDHFHEIGAHWRAVFPFSSSVSRYSLFYIPLIYLHLIVPECCVYSKHAFHSNKVLVEMSMDKLGSRQNRIN